MTADTEIDAAAALLRQGRWEAAFALLRPRAADERAAKLLFDTGMATLGAAHRPGIAEVERDALLDVAIAAFRAMLVADPGLDRVRLELARAFFAKGEDGLAARHFERVLAGEPPEAVAGRVRLFLAELRARRRWSLHAGLALAPDTNIAAASDERIIHVWGLPFHRDERELPESGVGVSLWAGGEYRLPLDERRSLRIGGDVWRREYRNSEFDRMTVSAHAGPLWRIGPDTEASVLAVASRHWAAGRIDSRDIGLRVEGWHRLTRRASVNLRASHLERRYRERGTLDGPVNDIALGGQFLAGATVRLHGAVGWSRERPKDETRRHAARRVQAGIEAALPLGITVGGGATLRWTDWEGDWFPFTDGGEARRDRTRVLRLDLHHRDLTLGGFSPRLSLARETRTSNAQAHGYERSFLELSFVRQF